METVNSQAPDRTKALEERVEQLNKTAAEIRRIQAQIEDHQENVKLLIDSLKDLQKKLLKQASDEIE